ncbi:DNA cytosine methyltransferase [Viridibacillus arvi]|uniref:DNA cytosine methyltransferase n=1 Tax=Viridibacillus arvi TaxID=263475 RepID=UPI003D012D5A
MKYKLVNSRDYGVPQLREQVFIVGVRKDLDFEYEFPNLTHGNDKGLKPYVTLRDAIGDLEQDPGPYFTGSYSSGTRELIKIVERKNVVVQKAKHSKKGYKHRAKLLFNKLNNSK